MEEEEEEEPLEDEQEGGGRRRRRRRTAGEREIHLCASARVRRVRERRHAARGADQTAVEERNI